MKYVTLAAFGNTLLYVSAGTLLLAVFTRLYTLWTPYHEFVEMRLGKKAPAFALGGAMLGFTFPILSMSYHGAGFIDFVVWSTIGGLVQAVLFKVLYWLIPMELADDNQAIGIFYAFAAVCIGLIKAFSLIPN